MPGGDVVEEFEEQASAAPSADALAADIAMGAGAAAGPEAREYLRKQIHLVDLQIAELRKEDRVRHWSLRVRHINELLKLAFGLSGALVVLILAAVLSALVWNSYDARGLIIQPIRTPPDFAARGLDGTMLAQRLLDKLNGLVADADKWSFRAADSIGGNWGGESKVEIPETGISVFELSRFLRQSLGHETAMSGELFHTASGIALTVRVGASPGVTFEGSDKDVDGLLSRAAQSLLAQTQPYRYVWLLYTQGKPAEFVAPIARQFVDAASGAERAWLQGALEQQLEFSGKFREAVDLSRTTISTSPANPAGYIDMAAAQWPLGHLEQAYDTIRTARHLLSDRLPRDFAPGAVPFLIANCDSFANNVAGAYRDAVAADIAESRTAQFDFSLSGPVALANDYALDHDVVAARGILASYHLSNDDDFLTPEFVVTTGPDLPNFFVRAGVADWAGARDSLERTDRVILGRNNLNNVRHTLIWPWLAYAWTQTGRLRDAQALIARTPLDCTLCLEMRGRIAEIAGDRKSAAVWFSRAIADAPSLPFSDTDWGHMLARHGDFQGAIARYRSALQRSPHYADADELWGEALMLENRSDLAIAKFADATKFAPNWGRMEMKWGEALSYLGRRAEALTHLRRAWTEGLSAADRAELASDLRA